MEITEVKVFPIHEEKLRAFVSIVFDHCFMVNDIKVIQGRDGLFISMPSRKKKNGEFKDIAHPLNNEARRTIEDRILAAFTQAIEPGCGNAPSIHPAALAGPAPAVAIGSMGAVGALGGVGRADGMERREVRAAEVPPTPEGKTLEELAELHLSDSFWSVT